MRLGAGDEAVALHHAVVEAGREPPLSAARVINRVGEALSGADAVDLARETLRRFV
jgi:hypothetical protein